MLTVKLLEYMVKHASKLFTLSQGPQAHQLDAESELKMLTHAILDGIIGNLNK